MCVHLCVAITLEIYDCSEVVGMSFYALFEYVKGGFSRLNKEEDSLSGLSLITHSSLKKKSFLRLIPITPTLATLCFHLLSFSLLHLIMTLCSSLYLIFLLIPLSLALFQINLMNW